MKNGINIVVGMVFASCVALAHSPDETNEVVCAILDRIIYSACDDLEEGTVPLRTAKVMTACRTWSGFLGLAGDCGWTQSERKIAFDWYLSTLGTNDCSALSGIGNERIRIALSQCDKLNYAEAVTSYKALALNPKGTYRAKAIDLALKFSPVDGATTEFVETIITNVSGYSSSERVECYWKYAKKTASGSMYERCMCKCSFHVLQ